MGLCVTKDLIKMEAVPCADEGMVNVEKRSKKRLWLVGGIEEIPRRLK